MEPLELLHVRNIARQRAKVAIEKVQHPDELHAEQLGRQLRQTHVTKLKTTSEC